METLWSFLNCWEPSVQFSCSVMSDSLRPHGLQHAKLPCPSPTPGAYSNSCPLSQWCHPTSHPLLSPSPPAFNISQHQALFQWVALHIKSIGASALAVVLPLNIQGWFLLGLTSLISLLSKGLSRVFSSTIVWNSLAILWHSTFFTVQLSHPYMTTGKTIALTKWTLSAKWCLCFLIHCLL